MRRTLLLLLALAAVVPARAQPPESTTATAPSPEAPLPGPDTPRGAIARFLDAARDGRYARAAEYLNLVQIPRTQRAQRGPELARELETVLDRKLWIDPSRLSDQPDGETDDELPPLRDSLGTIEAENGPVELTIERLAQAGGTPVWKVSSASVAAIPALYAEFGWGPLAKVLPAPFFELRLFQIRLWQWIGLALLVAVAWLVSWLARRLVLRIVHRLLVGRTTVNGRLAEQVVGPVRLAVGLAVFATGLPLLALAVPAHRVFVGAQSAVAILTLTWLVLRALDVFAAGFERRLEARHARAFATVPLGRRTIKVFVAIVAGIAALQNFGFNVTGLIAGLGVGGLVVALAAQKTVENFFGSVSLVADQPVRVGDVCRFGDTVGTVEDIGLRSTRIRTVDRTLVSVPNAQFSTLALENLSRRDRIPVRATVTLPQGTSAERVREVLAALHAMLTSQTKVDPASARVRFVRMGPEKLELEVFVFVQTRRWDEFVDVREQVFLRALEVVGEGGVGLG